MLRPFFMHPALNRAIIVKHHLRRNELEAFDQTRTSATKVLMPIDHDHLRAGVEVTPMVGPGGAGVGFRGRF